MRIGKRRLRPMNDLSDMQSWFQSLIAEMRCSHDGDSV